MFVNALNKRLKRYEDALIDIAAFGGGYSEGTGDPTCADGTWDEPFSATKARKALGKAFCKRMIKPSKKKVHYRNGRLFINAGMYFPECYSSQKMLDLDKGSLNMTSSITKVTCKRCLKILQAKLRK
jgi:hypothetical protein